MTDISAAHYDVIIVGLGPTGGMLANLLGMQGVRTLVLEREANMYDLPRAVHFDDEIMRAFQTIGIAHRLNEKVIVNKGMRFCDYDDNLLLDWPRKQSLTSNGWHASYRFHQPDLEQEIRQALLHRPSVQFALSSRVSNIGQSNDRASVTYQDVESNSHTVTSRYVVGCDGGSSFVREHLNIPMEILGFEQRWLVVDMLLNDEKPELGDHTIQYCDPENPATYCRNAGLRRRWEFALRDDQSDKDMTQDATIWQLLSRWINSSEARIERRAVYTFRSCVAERWRAGRILLAGDAAHLTPPFMGQGMCAGMRDVMNLAWKLAAVCNGTQTSDLLDTYQSERGENVKHYIQTAVKLGELINRIAAAPHAEKTARMESIISTLGPGLGDTNDPLRGTLFPQFRLSSGTRSDDYLGYRTTLFCRDRPVSASHEFETLSATNEPALGAVLDQLGVDEVIVRPDRYILSSSTKIRSITDADQASQHADPH